MQLDQSQTTPQSEINEDVYLLKNSHVTIPGTVTGNLYLMDSSHLTLTGTVKGDVYVEPHCQVIIAGTVTGVVTVEERATCEISGQVDAVIASQAAMVNRVGSRWLFILNQHQYITKHKPDYPIIEIVRFVFPHKLFKLIILR